LAGNNDLEPVLKPSSDRGAVSRSAFESEVAFVESIATPLFGCRVGHGAMREAETLPVRPDAQVYAHVVDGAELAIGLSDLVGANVVAVSRHQSGSDSLIKWPGSTPRVPRRSPLPLTRGKWLKCHTHDGRKAYGIPSSCGDGRYYLVTRTSCDCFDAQHHECKHILAVRLHCELVAEQQAAGTADDQAAEAGYRESLEHPETVVEVFDIFPRFDDDPKPLCGPLCGASGSRDRVCALPHYYTGAHSFVPRVERED
jgi:hypothetical protein